MLEGGQLGDGLASRELHHAALLRCEHGGKPSIDVPRELGVARLVEGDLGELEGQLRIGHAASLPSDLQRRKGLEHASQAFKRASSSNVSGARSASSRAGSSGSAQSRSATAVWRRRKRCSLGERGRARRARDERRQLRSQRTGRSAAYARCLPAAFVLQCGAGRDLGARRCLVYQPQRRAAVEAFRSALADVSVPADVIDAGALDHEGVNDARDRTARGPRGTNESRAS